MQWYKMRKMVLVLAFCMLGTACAKGVATDSEEHHTASELTAIPDESVEDTTTPETETAADIGTECPTEDETVPETIPDAEREVLNAIYTDIFGSHEGTYTVLKADGYHEYCDAAEWLAAEAAELTEQFLGSVTSEADAQEKARAVFAERLGESFIERIESDFVELNGEKVPYQRDNAPYTVTYYEEYDAWVVRPNYPSGITEDGRAFASPGMHPYLIIRGKDGKVLGVLI